MTFIFYSLLKKPDVVKISFLLEVCSIQFVAKNPKRVLGSLLRRNTLGKDSKGPCRAQLVCLSIQTALDEKPTFSIPQFEFSCVQTPQNGAVVLTGLSASDEGFRVRFWICYLESGAWTVFCAERGAISWSGSNVVTLAEV
jgi:hypothetical protein